jgi:hypothetical protein
MDDSKSWKATDQPCELSAVATDLHHDVNTKIMSSGIVDT